MPLPPDEWQPENEEQEKQLAAFYDAYLKVIANYFRDPHVTIYACADGIAGVFIP